MERGEHDSHPNYRLRYGALIVALVVVSQLGIERVSLGEVASGAMRQLASIASFSAAVEPNEYNTLAQAFVERDRELTEREKALIERERALDAKYQEEIASAKRATLITVGVASIVLVLLIVANFYFDIKREEEHERASGERRPTVDLT